MENWQQLIDSGLLELYVLGQTSEWESLFVEQAAESHQKIRDEINAIGLSMEQYALLHAVEPDPIIRPFLLATIDFSDRMKSGEIPMISPILNEHSSARDYQPWLERTDMVLPEDADDVFAKILSYTPEAITALVWIKRMAPAEVHDHEFERFLILEGSCDILVEDITYQLIEGDYFQIPLHKSHQVIVTSDFPCKVILQRVAA